jgi:hypothetical protein
VDAEAFFEDIVDSRKQLRRDWKTMQETYPRAVGIVHVPCVHEVFDSTSAAVLKGLTEVKEASASVAQGVSGMTEAFSALTMSFDSESVKRI